MPNTKLSTIFKSIFANEGVVIKRSLDVAYYVTDAALNGSIQINGISLGEDGKIHLFGNLSCAFEKRKCLEAKGLKVTIWKVDVSHCGRAEIDPAEEEISQTAPGEHNEICHGFIFTTAVLPADIIGIYDII
jgi:hypothetical protein